MSTVNEKMTAIANAIRCYVGGEKMGLDAMASGVHSVYVQGHHDGASLNNVPFEVHKITIANDLTSGENILLANNDFIKNHYTKEGFSIQLISLTANTTGPAVSYAYNGNRHFHNDVCGVMAVLTASGGNGNRHTTGNCYTVNYGNIPYVDANGNVKQINTTTNGLLRAGDYLIILSVAEVAE